jgi:N-acetylglucosaminyldiphosphoundecaprenol N-acetyl-beta-D-mannosaminyltransferase
MDVGGLPLGNIDLAGLCKSKKNQPILINFINAFSYYNYFNNEDFRKSMDDGVNLADGISIVFLSYIYNRKSPSRITGSDAFGYFLKDANSFNKKVLFIGSNHTTKKLFKRKMNYYYPDVIFQYISPSYFPDAMCNQENQLILEKINEFKPEYIFVGLSAPKQEIWSSKNKDAFNGVEYVLNVGAAFDFFAGTETRAPVFIRKIGLEGVFRTLMNPKKHFPKDRKSTGFILKKIFMDKILRKKRITKHINLKQQ